MDSGVATTHRACFLTFLLFLCLSLSSTRVYIYVNMYRVCVYSPKKAYISFIFSDNYS